MHDTFKNKNLSYECVVIGSGAGGALTSSFLAERGKEVLIIEEGDDLELVGDDCKMTNAVPELFREGGAIPILSNANFVFAEGRCLGGGTTVNGGLINRPSEKTINRWRNTLGLSDISYQSFMKYQDKIDKDLDVKILDQTNNVADSFFKKGAKALNFSGREIPVAALKENGRYKKNSMKETFLKKAQKNGARIITNCRIIRINFQDKRAISVDAEIYHNENERERITLSFKNLFVACGATQTPLLLQRSGVRKNIGNTLQLHPMLRVAAVFNKPIHSYATPMSSFQIKLPDINATVGSSISVPPMLASVLSFSRSTFKDMGELLPNTALFYVALHPYTNGVIRNIPLFRNNYLIKYKLQQEDVKQLSIGFAHLCRILL